MTKGESTGCMLLLLTEKMQNAMLDWSKLNTSASSQDVIKQARKISDRFFITGLIDCVKTGKREIYNPVFFCGDSEDISAVCDNIQKSYPAWTEKEFIRITIDEMYYLFISSLKDRKHDEFRNAFINCGFLILENVEHLSDTQTFQEELYIILDKLLESGHQVVFGGSVPANRIPNLDERLITIMDGGIYARVDNNSASQYERYIYGVE